MLEPFLRPRPAITLYGILAAFSVIAVLFSVGFGSFEVAVVAPFLVAYAFIRIAGILRSLREGGHGVMPWGFRLASWAVLLLPLLVSGLLLSLGGFVFAAAYCGLDAWGANATPKLLKDEGRIEPAPKLKRRLKLKGPVLLMLLVGAFVAWHFLFAIHQSWTALADWGAVAVLTALYLRVALAWGRRAKEEDARPPPHHKMHEPRERPLADPARSAIERGLEAFLRDGDVEALTWSARAIAATRGLDAEAARDLEERLLQVLSRPGSGRDRDLADAIEILEAAAIATTNEEARRRAHEVSA